MAGILVISLGIGAEKLGKKIADKRAEKKARKTAEVRTLLLLFTERVELTESSSINLSTDMLSHRLPRPQCMTEYHGLRPKRTRRVKKPAECHESTDLAAVGVLKGPCCRKTRRRGTRMLFASSDIE
jgi:hypothetical protein